MRVLKLVSEDQASQPPVRGAQRHRENGFEPKLANDFELWKTRTRAMSLEKKRLLVLMHPPWDALFPPQSGNSRQLFNRTYEPPSRDIGPRTRFLVGLLASTGIQPAPPSLPVSIRQFRKRGRVGCVSVVARPLQAKPGPVREDQTAATRAGLWRNITAYHWHFPSGIFALEAQKTRARTPPLYPRE